MLARQNRIRQNSDFMLVSRRGRRIVSRDAHFLLHVLSAPSEAVMDAPVSIGFVISTKVGNSVVRHRLKRQLSHILAPYLSTLEGGTRIVVRLSPGAGDVSHEKFSDEIARLMRRV